MLLGVHVEHEADERALEAGARAHVDGEPCSAELGGALKVEDAELLAEFPVRLGREVEVRLLAPRLDGDVIFLGFADGDLVAGKVGNACEGEAHLFVEGGRRMVEFVELFFESSSLVHHGGGVFAFALEGTDLLTELVAACFQLL